MAYVLVDPSGKSNATVGDIVVTGGGLYEKLKDGTSKLVGGLPNIGKTKNYSDVVDVFSKLASDGTTQDNLRETVQPDYTVKSVDDNGIATVEVLGYDPTDYTGYSAGSSTDISTVLGYIVLGLVGVALLDRFMNGGGSRG
jgi:hypothetical protein